MTSHEEILAEKYILDELKGEELKKFEEVLSQDEELQGFVNYLRIVRKGLEEYQEQKANRSYIEELSRKDKIRRQKLRHRRVMIGSVAAALMLTIGGYFYIQYIGNETAEGITTKEEKLPIDTFPSTIDDIKNADTIRQNQVKDTPINPKEREENNKLNPKKSNIENNKPSEPSPSIPIAQLSEDEIELNRIEAKGYSHIRKKTTFLGGGISLADWEKYFLNEEYDKALAALPKKLKEYEKGIDEKLPKKHLLIAGIIYMKISKPNYNKAESYLLEASEGFDYALSSNWFLTVLYYHQDNPIRVRKYIDLVKKEDEDPYYTYAVNYEKTLSNIGFLK